MRSLSLIDPVDTAELLREDDLSERYDMAKEAFDVRRIAIGENIRNEIKGTGLRQVDLARDLDIDAISMNRGFRPRNGKFEFPVARLSEFARRTLKMSGHELLFGINMPSRLPRYLSAIIDALMHDEEKKIQAISYITGDIWRSDRERKWRDEEYSILNNKGYGITELIADRLTEVSEGMYATVSLMFDSFAPFTIRNALRLAVEQRNRTLKMNTLMFVAMCLHTTVDYFISVDYTAYTDVRLYDPDEDQNAVIVRDRDTLVFLSYYLRLSKEGQHEAYAYLLRLIWE